MKASHLEAAKWNMLADSVLILPYFFPSRLNNFVEKIELNNSELNIHIFVKKIMSISVTGFCQKLNVFSKILHDNAISDD